MRSFYVRRLSKRILLLCVTAIVATTLVTCAQESTLEPVSEQTLEKQEETPEPSTESPEQVEPLDPNEPDSTEQDSQPAAEMPVVEKVEPQEEEPEETERQREQREAVEKERAERGGTIKNLKTKLKESQKAGPNKALNLTFDDLVFEMKKKQSFKRKMLTDEHNQLNKRRVALSGYIRPSSKQSGITKFVFVRDNLECCFGPGAALFDCVLVKLEKGRSTDYTVRPVTIEGEFYIKEFIGPNGKVWAVYRMKNGRVK